MNPIAADPAQSMLLALNKERFPFRYRGKKISVSQVDLLLKFKDINNTQQFTTGTPLGDFAGQGAPAVLNIYVTPAAVAMGQPPQAPPQPTPNSAQISLKSSPVNFNGAPYNTSSNVSPKLGFWWLQVFKNPAILGNIPPTLLDANGFLLPWAIDDILLVCHYSAG
jgi:hypothetical protein